MKVKDPAIVVVGSSNMDLVARTPRIPAAGETILGGDFLTIPGGKGANQAVAAAKLGSQVFFVAKLGADAFGRQSLANFQNAGVNTKYVTTTKDAPSGVALITVDEKGENAIVVAPGANSMLRPADVEAAKEAIAGAGAVVAQLEVPLQTVEYAAACAKNSGVPFILDPAPARKLPDELLAVTDIIKPNETEAKILTGIEVKDDTSAKHAAYKLLEKGVGAVVITMGAAGFLLATKEAVEFVEAIKVNAVDSTAAGDAFTGSLAAGIAEGKTLRQAAEFANTVAAVSVTKWGAQSSMPTTDQVREFLMTRR